LPADRVWVNTATAELTLYRADRPAFATRVIVGQTDKQTPEFRTTIDSLLYNPPWNVPRSIITNEIGPKLSQDPGYLARHHMVVRHNGLIEQLPPPIPVYVVYQTAFLGSAGALSFAPDLYQRDEEIWRHLQPARQAPVAQREQPAPRRG